MIKKILGIPKLVKEFIVGTYSELKATEYLSRKKTVSYTLLVLGFLVLGTIFILGVDSLFLSLRTFLFSI